jgi:PAS domain S-box-containing protein
MESDLSRVVDALPGLVWTVLADGQFDFMNQRWSEYTGLAVDASYGRGWQVAVHPEDLPGLLAGWRGGSSSGAPVESTVRLRGADGSYRWFLFRAHPSADASGQVVKWCGLSTDIDDRMQAEEALRARASRFRLIVDGLPVLLSTATPNGELEHANRHYLNYFGATLEELKAREAPQNLHPDDQERVRSARRAAIDTGQPYEIECRRRRADGVYRWFYLRAFPLRDAEGRIALWYRLQTDIEEQKRAEALLAGEKQLLEMVAGGRPMPDILEALCRHVESTASGCYCSIVLVDPSGTQLQEAIAPSLAAEFNDAVRGWPLQRVGGPCAMVARDKVQVIMSDVASDTRWRNSWRALAQAHGLRSCWSTPIVSQAGQVLGTFALYRREPGSPDSSQLELIAQFTNIASIAIERAQRDEALRQSEARRADAERELQLTIDSIPAMVATYRADGSRLSINKRVREYTGRSSPEDWSRTVHPDDIEPAESKWRACIASGEPFEHEYRVRQADGTYRWFMRHRVPLRDETGQVIRWYGVGYDIEDRKRAEAALRQSETRIAAAERQLQRTIDTIPAKVATYEPDGTRSFVNQQWRNYIEATGDVRSIVRHFHPDDTERADRAWRNALATGEPLSLDMRIRRADGEFRWHTHHCVPLHDEQGTIVKWYAAEVDIEDKKRAENALLRSEARLADAEHELRVTLDSIPTITWRAAPNGYVQHLNKRWFEYTGTTPEQVHGWRWKLCVHPDDLDHLVDIGNQYVATGKSIDAEARVRRHDGTYRWFLFRPAPARDETGKVVGWYGAITDIEDRRRAEEELRRSEAFLAEGQRLSQTGSFSWRVDTGEVTFSQELHRIFEFDQDAAVTLRRLRERTHPEDRALMDEKVSDVRAGRNISEIDIRLRMPDGGVKYLRILGRLSRRQDGRLEFLGAIQDVTQGRLAEAALDKVRSELAHVTRVMSFGALTASIAHEVNQPLAGIVTNASTCLRMLAAEPPNIEGARETARRTIRDGNRAADVIARLRALFSKKAAETETVDLNEATREVLTLVFSDLLRNKVILRAELDSDHPPLVTGDRVQLQQVILNLVRNASDAMSEVNDRPRDLLVKAYREEEGARLIVKDAGVGFETQGAERLFDAFYTTKSGGMGIGLSLSRSIIENHGGKLWAEANDGPGATFSVSIPRQATSAGDEGTAGAILTRPMRGERDATRNA